MFDISTFQNDVISNPLIANKYKHPSIVDVPSDVKVVSYKGCEYSKKENSALVV